jgi:arylsulfatase A
VFLADDLGTNDVSSYRTDRPLVDKPSTAQTPFIDRIAKNGMRFTDFYCGAPVCSPSRAALLTGRNATRLGIYNWIPSNTPMHLRHSETTIPEMLKTQGYMTAHFGKWHLTPKSMPDNPPTAHGFDYAFWTHNNARPSHRNPTTYYRNDKPLGELEGYACQLVAAEAIQWLEKSVTSDEPFYLNLWFNEPHDPLAAPPEMVERHAYNGEYYGCIENMDDAIGRVMTYLREKGLLENTLVLFSSDNGSKVPGSNDPLRGEKGFTYEGGVRVPFIASWPGTIPSGSVSGFEGSFTDLLPTIAALTGAELPEARTLDGIDMSPALVHPGQKRRPEPIFFYRYFTDPACMLRQGDWILLGYQNEPPTWKPSYDRWASANIKPGPGEKKWSRWAFDEEHQKYIIQQSIRFFELYNVRDDISQRENLAEKHPERVAAMKKTMLQLREEMISEGGNWFDRP